MIQRNERGDEACLGADVDGGVEDSDGVQIVRVAVHTPRQRTRAKILIQNRRA